jgi:hypothetical protein
VRDTNNCIQDETVSDVGCEDDPDDLDQKSVLSPPHSSASEVMGYERCAEDFPPFEEMMIYPREEEDA